MEAWTKCTCSVCGLEYIFMDGPICKCRDEKELWEEEFAIEFKDGLTGVVWS